MLKLSKTIFDPLGNAVQLPLIFSTCGRDYNDISQVIVAPSFIIQVRDEKLYFFRLITWETNIVVEACLCSEVFLVNNWIENPTKEYVSCLLQKGSLISFQ